MNKYLLYTLTIVVIILLLAGEIVALAYFSHDTWDNRLGFVLQIIAFYGIGIGFVQKSNMLKDVAVLEDLGSPNPIRFISSNLIFLGMFFSILGIALGPRREKGSSTALGCLGTLIILSTFPVLLLYAVVHIFLLCPPAYIGYLFSSALVEGITGSADDTELIETSQDGTQNKLRLKEAILSNKAATKSFVIGIPAAVLAIATKLIALFSH